MIRNAMLLASLLLSTVLSAGFYYSLGHNWLSGVFLAVLGVIFEGLKAYSWQQTGDGRYWYLWLGVPCTVLSLVASIGYASLTLEHGWSAADSARVQSEHSSAQVSSLENEADALVATISKLPPGWTTSALRLTAELDRIRASQNVVTQAASTASESTTSLLIMSLATRFGLSGVGLVTALLIAIAAVLEVGIVVLVLDRSRPKRPDAPPGRPEHEIALEKTELDLFLEQAVRSDGTLLGRRRLVELGWSERQVRDHVTTLYHSGVLTRAGRGSPLVLARGTPNVAVDARIPNARQGRS